MYTTTSTGTNFNYCFLEAGCSIGNSGDDPQSTIDNKTATNGQVNSISAGFAFGGGYFLEIGKVSDGKGGSKWFFSHGPTIGYGLGLSFNHHRIKSTDNSKPFNVGMYAGPNAGYEVGYSFFGGYFGGNLPLNNKATDGFGNFGVNFYEGGLGGGLSGGPKFGIWWSKTNTILFD